MLRFGPRTVFAVLALFIASTVASALPLLSGDEHAPGHADAPGLASAGVPGAGTDQSPDRDGAKCTHACHFLQHFQASVDQPPALGFDRRAASYSVAEVPAPPQLLQETSFHPPRIPARSV